MAIHLHHLSPPLQHVEWHAKALYARLGVGKSYIEPRIHTICYATDMDMLKAMWEQGTEVERALINARARVLHANKLQDKADQDKADELRKRGLL